jgi:hypothetical protein
MKLEEAVEQIRQPSEQWLKDRKVHAVLRNSDIKIPFKDLLSDQWTVQLESTVLEFAHLDAIEQVFDVLKGGQHEY